MSQTGEERPYKTRPGKDRSVRQSRHSIASAAYDALNLPLDQLCQRHLSDEAPQSVWGCRTMGA